MKLYGPQKLHVALLVKLPFVGKQSYIFEKKIKLMSEPIYSAITPRLIFVYQSVLKIVLKDPISYMDKICVIYSFICLCERSFDQGSKNTYPNL